MNMSSHIFFRYGVVFCLLLLCPRRSYPDTGAEFEGVKLSNIKAIPGMAFTDEQKKSMKLWDGGVIPYFVDGFSYDSGARQRINYLLQLTNTQGGVSFTELNQIPDTDKKKDFRYIFFVNRSGKRDCMDFDTNSLSMTGAQRVVIGYDCMEQGDVAALILQILGVPAMHNAPNRDDYITVNLSNVMQGKEKFFTKWSEDNWPFKKMDYDYGSVSHFDYHKYTKNGGETILVPDGKGEKLRADTRGMPLGEADEYTYEDMKKMRLLYNYITKYEKQTNAGQCSQLFKLANNYTDYVPEKPEPPKAGDDDNDNVSDNAEEVQDNKQDADAKSDDDDGEKLKDVSHNNRATKVKQKHEIDRIQLLSDINTS